LLQWTLAVFQLLVVRAAVGRNVVDADVIKKMDPCCGGELSR